MEVEKLAKGYVYVKLQKEWLGIKRWTILAMAQSKAEELQNRDVAKILTLEEVEKDIEKKEEKNLKKQKNESDKMIKDSINK